MREIKEEEIDFLWKLVLKGIRQEHNNYMSYVYKKKKYKRSRVLYQIYHRVYLEKDDIIHHKNRNKLDDHISNLQLISNYEHKSLHNIDMKVPKMAH